MDLPEPSRHSDHSCHVQTSCELIKNQELTWSEIVENEEQERNREELLYKRDPKDTEEVCNTPDSERIPTADNDSAQELQVSLDYKGRPLAGPRYVEMSRAFLRGYSPYDEPVKKVIPSLLVRRMDYIP